MLCRGLGRGYIKRLDSMRMRIEASLMWALNPEQGCRVVRHVRKSCKKRVTSFPDYSAAGEKNRIRHFLSGMGGVRGEDGLLAFLGLALAHERSNATMNVTAAREEMSKTVYRGKSSEQ